MKKIRNSSALSELMKSILKNKPGRTTIIVSAGTCGLARGAAEIHEALARIIKDQRFQNKVNLRITGCHGFCEAEPNVVVTRNGETPEEGIFYQKLKVDDAKKIVTTAVRGKIFGELLYVDPVSKERFPRIKDIGFYKNQSRVVLGNNLLVNPVEIEDYLAIGGYSALSKVLGGLTPEGVVETVKKSHLRGRGGAGFPTGLKWEICRKANGDAKYVICNADEGDPGAYMDRSLLEGNPHCVVEGMIIGAFAIGATQGIVYVRTEYPLAVKNVNLALEKAREIGFLGRNILGSGFDFDIAVIQGAGAFVCGEETALISSIEGKIGIPKQRPPFPAMKGLWGKPTNINNVETWANVPLIINKGADWYSRIGTETSKGTKIFSLVGKINNTGLVEVPMGITLREIVYEIGGGILEGKKFKAVQTGGPSGGCIPADMIDLPVDYEKLTQVGSIMGSGGMIVMDENTCMVDLAKYFMNFLRDESCGKCLSCREGTNRMYEILTDITEGHGTGEQIEVLEELARAVKDTSMCGLGQSASNPVLSTLRYFKDEYLAHVEDKWCPALVCKRLIPAPCQDVCPAGIDVPSYVGLIALGKYIEAVDLIREDNPFPAVCGRVCNHPCELNCKMGEYDKPVSICSLKRFCADYALTHGGYRKPRMLGTAKEKVAIIGSGPAGLSAAYFLARMGYRVTVFEALPVAGGMLEVGIPAYRLPREIIRSEIDAICALGVEIKTNTRVGKDLSIDDIRGQGFKAIFVAVGAHKSLKMGLPGEPEFKDVIDCAHFLKTVNLDGTKKPGDRIVIIGDDHVALDTARVCCRLDSKEVNVVYWRTEKEMPVSQSEIDQAAEEGVKFHFLAIPRKILGEAGKVTGLECVRARSGKKADDVNRKQITPIEDSEFVIGADTIMRAVGQEPDLSFLDSGFEISDWGLLQVDPKTRQTNIPDVFAGGDAVTGPATVIEAIASGKKAAASIDSFLKGEKPREYAKPKPRMTVERVELTQEELKRPEMPLLSIEARRRSFDEAESGFTEQMALKEAKRCRRCDLEK